IKAGYIGYWLSKDKQGHGLLTSACNELEEIGFNLLCLNKIEIHVAKENHKSRAVAERLGYSEKGVILDAEWLYDRYVDHVIYCKKASNK
ncbi:MAG: GNAT family N-acetyltransferase, partial [Gammaproteobacteria bacterium]|nr:GNAT family N-acetyltransferase [Gammaproteobacteria bacterium]